MKNLQLTLCLLVKDWMLSLWSQEKKDRNIFSYHLYSDYTGDSSHCRQVKKKEKERYWDCKEVKTDFYYRPNVHLCRKCDGIYQKELLSDFNKLVGYRANNTK